LTQLGKVGQENLLFKRVTLCVEKSTLCGDSVDCVLFDTCFIDIATCEHVQIFSGNILKC